MVDPSATPVPDGDDDRRTVPWLQPVDRALGATRRHVAAQFLVESLLLGAGGGAAGVMLGTVVTHAMATVRGWQTLVPAAAVGAGLAAVILIGGLAGVYPAVRAARLSPTAALRTA